MRVSTDIPGSRRSSSFWPWSNSIRTGMRWTTLVKLPVALSGGSSANCEPLAGAIRSTRPCSFSLWKLSTGTSTGWPGFPRRIWGSFSLALQSTSGGGTKVVGVRGQLLRLALRNGGVLQLDLVGEIVERRLRADHAGLGLRDLGLVVSGIDLNQEIAGLDALKVVRGDGENFTGDPAAQPCQFGPDIRVVRALDHFAADPGIPAQHRQRDEPPPPQPAQ